MAPKRVLKFVRTDEEGHVLVHVSSKGSKALDLKLVGTESAAPYTCSLRHDRVSSLRVKNCPVSETEWQTILLRLFQQELLSDIQVTATVQSESSITVTIRKQVQGITVRLGTIVLNYQEDETIELFDWCAISVDALTQSQESASKSEAKLGGIQASVDDLKSQLDELIRAKQDDEAALLQKCRDLLNEKKVKIRQQQKVIAELSSNAPVASTDPRSMDEPPSPPRKRAAKRKAKTVEPEEPEEDVATVVKSEPESDAGDTTEATASTDEEDGVSDTAEDNQAGGETKKQPTAPPPPRSLPFQRKKPVAAATASDSDDEL